MPKFLFRPEVLFVSLIPDSGRNRDYGKNNTWNTTHIVYCYWIAKYHLKKSGFQDNLPSCKDLRVSRDILTWIRASFLGLFLCYFSNFYQIHWFILFFNVYSFIQFLFHLLFFSYFNIFLILFHIPITCRLLLHFVSVYCFIVFILAFNCFFTWFFGFFYIFCLFSIFFALSLLPEKIRKPGFSLPIQTILSTLIYLFTTPGIWTHDTIFHTL